MRSLRFSKDLGLVPARPFTCSRLRSGARRRSMVVGGDPQELGPHLRFEDELALSV
jgi:hypothetical protein